MACLNQLNLNKISIRNSLALWAMRESVSGDKSHCLKKSFKVLCAEEFPSPKIYFIIRCNVDVHGKRLEDKDRKVKVFLSETRCAEYIYAECGEMNFWHALENYIFLPILLLLCFLHLTQIWYNNNNNDDERLFSRQTWYSFAQVEITFTRKLSHFLLTVIFDPQRGISFSET